MRLVQLVLSACHYTFSVECICLVLFTDVYEALVCGGGDPFNIRKLDVTMELQPNGRKALSVLISDNNTSCWSGCVGGTI